MQLDILEVTVTSLPPSPLVTSSPPFLDEAPVYRSLNPRRKPVAKTTFWTDTIRIKCLP